MHHCKVGHSCDGLIYQEGNHLVSHGYSIQRFIFAEGLPHPPIS